MPEQTETKSASETALEAQDEAQPAREPQAEEEETAETQEATAAKEAPEAMEAREPTEATPESTDGPDEPEEPEEPHAGPGAVETRTSEEHTTPPEADAEVEASAAETESEETPEPETETDEPITAEAAESEDAEPAVEAASEPEPEEAKAQEGQEAAEETQDAAEAQEAQGAGSDAGSDEAEEEELTEQDKVVQQLRTVKEEDGTIEGKVIGWNQGGFHVVIDGVTTFCPRSEMEIKNPKSPSFYMDKTFEFKVIKHQKRGRRIVLSRKKILMGEREDVVQDLYAKAQSGETMEGRVSSLTDFGAFVDLGGIEGLVHVTEISHTRVGHPKDRLQVGQKVEVKVLKVEEDGDRISLSMKALEPNPWQAFADDNPRGSKFEGKVVRKTDFGVFVELQPGLDGMIHVSQLPPGMTLGADTLEVGNEIEGWVLRTEAGRERISLSLREVPEEDPWKNIRERYPEGKIVEGEVEDVADFGVFILLEPGLTGLLPNSYLNLPRGQDAGRFFPPGKKVQIQVESVDPQRKRISLAQEGQRLEGGRADYKEYVQQQKKQEPAGMSAMEAAFAKLKEQQNQQQEA